jgi:dTDP-4-amino-4,6-dideoxygalactose transaminase
LTVPLADLVAQYASISAEIAEAIQGVLEDGHFILGPVVEDLEARIAEFSGAAYAVGVNSGTDAILLALRANGVGPGDEVVTTPFTFVATIETVAQLGATPVFADIDPSTFNLSPRAAEERISERTRALLPVDLFGQPADRAAFGALAERHSVRLTYDAAQAIGARFEGAPVGATGDAATLSFFPTKNLGAYGDGGMVLTNDASSRDTVRRLRFHGSGGGYRYLEIGYCSRLDALQAAVLRVKLEHLPAWTDARRRNAEVYRAMLAGTRCVLPFEDPRAFHVYHQFTVRHPERDALRRRLAEEGVQSGIYYPSPLHLQEAYTYLGYRRGDFPEAERACREVLSLPIHPELTVAQIEHTCRTIRAFDRAPS